MVTKKHAGRYIITDADHKHIATAIRKAEAKTSGEIYVVLAGESDDYFYPACCVMSFVTLVLAIICAFWMHWNWRDIPLHYFGFGMLVFFILSVLYLIFIPSLRLWVTPPYIKKQRAHLNAMRQFMAHNVHRTRHRTAVLLFISLAERYAEVIADTGINENVAPCEWQEIVDILTSHARKGLLADGYIKAIGRAGKLLGQYFPASSHDENVLPDHLIEL